MARRRQPVTAHQLEAHKHRCAALAARLDRNHWKQRAERAEAAIRWALGYEDFPERKPGQGAYWWRTELRDRAEFWRHENEDRFAKGRVRVRVAA